MSVVHFATRTLTLNGVEFRAGDVVPTEGLSLHRFKQLVALRVLRGEVRVEPVVRPIATLLQPMAEALPAPVKVVDYATKIETGSSSAKRRTRKER